MRTGIGSGGNVLSAVNNIVMVVDGGSIEMWGLVEQIKELRDVLQRIRDEVESNLENPGNEGDTLEWIIDVIDNTLEKKS
jgi:hypothetical protein